MALPLSRILRARLSELGLSIDGLISRSDLAKSTIYSYLDDTRNPQGTSLRKLAAGLEWTAAELQARMDGTALVSPVTDEQIARIVERLPNVPKDRLDAIEQHVTLAMQAIPPAKTREAGPTNGPRRRRSEILTGVDVGADHDPKRRQFSIRKVQTWGEHAVVGVLSALGLNRDFRPVEAAA